MGHWTVDIRDEGRSSLLTATTTRDSTFVVVCMLAPSVLLYNYSPRRVEYCDMALQYEWQTKGVLMAAIDV